MQGRFHTYEGYNHAEIGFPIYVFKKLGIQSLLISNAAGGINLMFKKGDIIAIKDYINLQNSNPLIGKNIDEMGVRFPDMSNPISLTWQKLYRHSLEKINLPFISGVYAGVNGPMLETRAEYRYLGIIGAELVGMSTISEIIVANHCNMECFAVSIVTDECDPDNLQAVTLEDIITIAKSADAKLSEIFINMIMQYKA